MKDERDILGKKVRCRVTGFEGIVTAVTYYLQGCARVQVQPPYDPKSKGELKSALHIDYPQAEVIGEGVCKMVQTTSGSSPGGPMGYSIEK